MTVIGMVISAPDSAMVWADTAIFRDRQPVGHQPKLIVNASARIVGAATGWVPLAQRFDEAVIRAMGIDELAEALPPLLRRESATIAGRRSDPEQFLSNSFCLAGWSTQFSRFIGLTLLAETYFEPRRVFAFSSPHAPELAAMGAISLDDVTGLILGQVSDLGLETTGPVIGATLTMAGVSTRTLLNLEPAS